MEGNKTDINSTMTLNSDEINESMKILLLFCEAFNGLLILLTIWILISLFVYGRKTGCWTKKSGNSSYNSGIVFDLCFVVGIIVFLRFVYTAVKFQLPRIEYGLEHCELMGKLGSTTYFASMYSIYLFLWLRQRIIFGHPAVRDLMGLCVNALSWITFVGLTLISLGTFCYYVISTKYRPTALGCTKVPSLESNVSYATMAVMLLFLVQVLIVSLFTYIMIRTNIAWTKISSETSESTNMASRKNNNLTSIWHRMIFGNKNKALETNPVARNIRSSVVSGTIMLITDILATAVVSLIIPPTIPRTMTDTLYNTSIFIDLICILITFGNRLGIFTALFRLY
ncbi:uncharacterized protein LOC144428168 [Styela clava]